MENFYTPSTKTGHPPKNLFGIIVGTGATKNAVSKPLTDEIISEVLVDVDQEELPDLLVTGQLLDDDDIHITSPEEEEEPRSVLQEVQNNLIRSLMSRGNLYFPSIICSKYC